MMKKTQVKIRNDLSNEDIFINPEQQIELIRIKKEIEKNNKIRKEREENKNILSFIGLEEAQLITQQPKVEIIK